ncbi:precorrin-3B C(17)-methyltransferase [Thermosynechococcaceae cyanobacterium Okahandja]
MPPFNRTVHQLETWSPLAAIATTRQGATQLEHLRRAGIEFDLWLPAHLAVDIEDAQRYSDSLASHLNTVWHHYRSWLFTLACGAVVRLIAPLLEEKRKDPAVCVLSEDGQWLISLVGSHGAGGDRLCQILAAAIGATPILTGASHTQRYFAVDCWGKALGWQHGAGDWNRMAALQAQQQVLSVFQTCGSELWRTGLAREQPIKWVSAPPQEAAVWITEKAIQPDVGVVWHPRVLWLGIGCERGTDAAVIEAAITQTLEEAGLARAAIAGLASIDRKADEVGLLQVAQRYQWPIRWFSAAQLQQVTVPTPSAIVAAEMGTPSVAEAAALLASDRGPLLVPKQIYRHPAYQGAVTVAVAQSRREYIPRKGAIALIGTGPGALDQLTMAARTALLAADVWMGYELYLKLLTPLQQPGQMVCTYPITQERERAQAAIELASWGLHVAVVSSGDCGIYGMAGLVLELLMQSNRSDLAVNVFPGVSAVNAAAARVGAPLMHDFCTISLSDRLTPWPVIEARLEAAAKADFVTALYNPRSRDRQQQLVQAQQIFQRHRPPSTPVAIVRAAYRPEEQITLTTLAAFQPAAVDMFSLVLIGNATTRRFQDWLITPRGYLAALEYSQSSQESKGEGIH